ncbi:MAG: hypothetical protein ACREP1_10010 [Rhodanobacteraceae bacterium]
MGRHQIAIHPIVLGELATGNLAQRARTLAALGKLPHPKVGSLAECLHFIDAQGLFGRAIGWNDVQLLVAARLSRQRLWSLDARLVSAAADLGVVYRPG